MRASFLDEKFCLRRVFGAGENAAFWGPGFEIGWRGRGGCRGVKLEEGPGERTVLPWVVGSCMALPWDVGSCMVSPWVVGSCMVLPCGIETEDVSRSDAEDVKEGRRRGGDEGDDDTFETFSRLSRVDPSIFALSSAFEILPNVRDERGSR